MCAAGLRARGNTPQFDETKTEPGQAIYVIAVFIEAGSQPNRVWKFQAHYLDWFVDATAGNESMELLQQVEADIVGQLGIDRKQQWSDQLIRH